jgi:hypothetical protein
LALSIGLGQIIDIIDYARNRSSALDEKNPPFTMVGEVKEVAERGQLSAAEISAEEV